MYTVIFPVVLFCIIDYKYVIFPGVLFYASTYAGGNGDFISLNIVDRRVEFRFNMGSGTIVIS